MNESNSNNPNSESLLLAAENCGCCDPVNPIVTYYIQNDTDNNYVQNDTDNNYVQNETY